MTLRIHVVEPPVGVAYALQAGKGASSRRLPHVVSDGGTLTFELELSAREGKVKGTAKFTGPFAQGTPGDRFFYLGAGASTGAGEPHWQGRVKVPVWMIPWALVERVDSDDTLLLEASFQGRNSAGGTALATVALIGAGWEAVPR